MIKFESSVKMIAASQAAVYEYRRVDGKDPLTAEGDLIRVSFFTQQSMKAPSANEVFIDC